MCWKHTTIVDCISAIGIHVFALNLIIVLNDLTLNLIIVNELTYTLSISYRSRFLLVSFANVKEGSWLIRLVVRRLGRETES